MLNIRRSSATSPSDVFVESPRSDGEDNLMWIARQLGAVDDSVVSLLLVGGVDAHSMRLRIAQSHVRDTMSPSNWSHVALVAPAPDGFALDGAEPRLVEIALQPVGGFRFPAPTNGVQDGRLDAYADAARFPNVALIHFHATDQQRDTVFGAVEKFKRQRNVLDATELIVMWLAYAWGVGRTPNPLLEGHGIPSAAMIEILFSAAGYDLTPGLDSRASCPEAMWQAARWYHGFYESRGGSETLSVPFGAWTTPHQLEFAAERVP